MEISTANNNIQ